MYKVGTVFEKITTKATEAKKIVDDLVSKLAAKNAGVCGKPDNILVTSEGLIKEVEEVKYFGKDTIEELGLMARKNPSKFVREGLGEGKHIQINRHVNTINEINKNPLLLQGTIVTGISKDLKYVVTLPKMAVRIWKR